MKPSETNATILPIKYIRTQQIVVEGRINRKRIPLLIDTGASHTVFHTETARLLGLVMEESSQLGGGVGGVEMSLYKLRPMLITLGGVEWLCPKPAAMDLSHVMLGLKRARARQISAILGADFLRKYQANIDYSKLEMSLFLV